MTQQWGEMVGTWSLDRVIEFGDDERVRGKPYGDQPAGQLVYTADGHMAVVISGYGSAPAVAYAGRVEVGQDRIRHVVGVGVPPYTEDQERFARIEDRGTSLVLATDRPGRPRIELRWVRCSPESSFPTRRRRGELQ